MTNKPSGNRRTITLQDGRKLRISKSQTGIIIIRGCGTCGHGLLVNNGSDTGICVWEGKEYHLNNDFLTELRSLS